MILFLLPEYDIMSLFNHPAPFTAIFEQVSFLHPQNSSYSDLYVIFFRSNATKD